MLDSVSGYQLAMREERLTQHMHALCRYLTNMGVTVILPNEVDSIAGTNQRITSAGLSYLADTIILLRYFEMDGKLLKSVGVLKKRTSNFEKSIRQFEISSYGMKIGPPLRGLQGVLTGIPQVGGDAGQPRQARTDGGSAPNAHNDPEPMTSFER
jgi:circadian clock protein KaiC